MASIIQPGAAIKVAGGGYWHYGIADDTGNVIHNSKRRGGIIRSTIAEFAEGRSIHGCLELRAANTAFVLQRAHQALGLRYDLFARNCEHFVRWAYGLEPESRQIQRAILTASGLATMHTGNSKAAQMLGFGVTLGALHKEPVRGALIGSLISLLLIIK